jgi:thymidylate synthase (FAD)
VKVEPKVTLLEHTPEPDKVVAAAARLCYSSDDIQSIMENFTQEKIDKFVNMLSEMGHESPFEHVSFTFGIEGVSRAFSHQLVRHRIASYSQKSQRYVTEGQFNYIVPPSVEENEATDVFTEAMENAQKSYDKIFNILLTNKCKNYMREIDLVINQEQNPGEWFKEHYKKEYTKFEKQAAEDARFVLPNACETKIVVTMNARALWNFFANRCCNRAQWEIRYIAKQMLAQCKDVAPTLFSNAGAHCVSGICPENNMQCDQFKGKIPQMNEVKELIQKYYHKD